MMPKQSETEDLGVRAERTDTMREFEKKELIGSLFCPALTLLWGTLRILLDSSWGAEFTGRGSFRLTTFVAVFIGGILPIIMTLAGKIHTEQYLIKRLITIVIVYVITGFIGLIGYPVIMFPLEMLVYIGAIICQIMKVQNENTSGGERAVLILSDPIVYWTVYWCVFWIIELFLDI